MWIGDEAAAEGSGYSKIMFILEKLFLLDRGGYVMLCSCCPIEAM